MAIESAKLLHDLGVPLALSAHGSTSAGSSLGRQAGWAMRGGLPFDAALAAVTITPARLIGVDDRVGSLEVGKDADLVLWSGEPFEASSAVIGVLVDGRLVLDPRASAEKAD
jgi:imidazolonepropionase-like amidohydrolase